MKLKEARNSAIKYCKDNNCSYTCIAHDEASDFYLTDSETRYTVFLVNKNGSMDAYLHTKYAIDFHNELKRRKKNRRKNDKRKIADMCNQEED